MKNGTGALRVAFFNYSDRWSGAEALIDQTILTLIARGVDARLFVMDRFTDKSYVHTLPHFFGERRMEYTFRKATGRNNFLFPSTAFLGFDSWIKGADLWHFHNLHGHFASIPLLARQSLKRPIVLSPVDQFLATGYCTYTLGCERFRDACGECPQLGLPYPGISRDTTSSLLAMKKASVAKSRFNILVHTKYLAEFYGSTFVSGRPIEQIYYGVNTNLFRPLDREACAARFNIPPADKSLTVGLIHSDVDDKRKGLLSFLSPLQSLANQEPGRIRVLAIGRSSEQVKEYANDNLPIWTLPFLPDQEALAMALNLCDVLLYPTHADNLSLTCLSALACGVPVVSSRVGGQGEAVKDGVNGFLCEPDRPDQFIASLEQLVKNPELRTRMSCEARRTVTEQFDLERYADNLIAYYDRVVQSWKGQVLARANAAT
jgi:glycosyltransferase involved in cell wall biosynthesis